MKIACVMTVITMGAVMRLTRRVMRTDNDSFVSAIHRIAKKVQSPKSSLVATATDVFCGLIAVSLSVMLMMHAHPNNSATVAFVLSAAVRITVCPFAAPTQKRTPMLARRAALGWRWHTKESVDLAP
jgi:hypothetical protein